MFPIAQKYNLLNCMIYHFEVCNRFFWGRKGADIRNHNRDSSYLGSFTDIEWFLAQINHNNKNAFQ